MTPKVNLDLYFDRVVAEGHRVDGATPRIEVWRGIDAAEPELDAHAAGVDLDALGSHISKWLHQVVETKIDAR